jgi:uroporphyrinogen decarboxylase
MTEMTSRERVLAAARRQTPDRVPRSIQTEAYVSTVVKKKLGTEDLLAAFRGDVAGVGPNPTRLTNDYRSYFTNPAMSWDEWGRGRIWDSQQQYAEYFYPLEQAESVDEILHFPWPDLDAPYRYAGLELRVSQWQAKGYAVCGGLAETVFEIAWQLRSMARLFDDIIHEDEKAAVLLDAITDRRVACAQAYARAGVDMIQLGDDVAMQDNLLMSRKMWRAWFGPRLKRVIDAAREIKPDVLIEYHSDGKINNLVPDLLAAGIDILNPVQPECVDHRWIKAEFGGQLSFSGGLGVQSVLPFGTPDEVRTHVRETIEALGAGGGLIIGPSHVVERDVPLDNFFAMLAAIDEFGSY